MSARAVWVSLGMIALLNTAMADDAGVYVSAGGGVAKTGEDAALGVPGVAPLFGEADGTNPSWGLGLGYRVNRNISLDLGYVDLGDIDANVADISGGSGARATFGFSAKGTTLALLGTFPIGNWEPYVKAGVLFSETELTFSGRVSGTPFNARIRNKDEDAIYGAGVRYALGDRIKLYFDVTYLMEVGGSGGGQADFFNTSAGVIWQF